MKTIRSILFVPADSEKKIAKAQACGADAVILDLEDSVAPARLGHARVLAAEYLLSRADAAGPALWVRINGLDSPDSLKDLAAVMKGAPAGIVLPKVASPAQLSVLRHCIQALEAAYGIAPDRTSILPVVTETPTSMLSASEYLQHGAQVAGLTWGAEDLATALGAQGNRDERGEYLFPFQLARTVCLFLGGALEVPAFDTITGNFSDEVLLAKECAEARRLGFSGKLAIHPSQIPVINESFRATAEEVAWARAVLDAFDKSGEIGTVALNGNMLDLPHLKRARHMLARANAMRDA